MTMRERPGPSDERLISRFFGLCLVILALVLGSAPALAHDASSYGGLFRSRDATRFMVLPSRSFADRSGETGRFVSWTQPGAD